MWLPDNVIVWRSDDGFLFSKQNPIDFRFLLFMVITVVGKNGQSGKTFQEQITTAACTKVASRRKYCPTQKSLRKKVIKINGQQFNLPIFQNSDIH